NHVSTIAIRRSACVARTTFTSDKAIAGRLAKATTLAYWWIRPLIGSMSGLNVAGNRAAVARPVDVAYTSVDVVRVIGSPADMTAPRRAITPTATDSRLASSMPLPRSVNA